MNILPRPTDLSLRLMPVEPRLAPVFCFMLLTVASALASFALACATPFAALAVVAAAMLPLGRALVVVTGVWLVNQTIGFGVLHYPVDANTILWGFVIGLAALVATVASMIVLWVSRRNTTAPALAFALIGAYGGYELTILAATPFLGGAGNFTLPIVVRLGLLNVFWLIGLVAICEIVRAFNPIGRGQAAS